jgi:hypothetical protein
MTTSFRGGFSLICIVTCDVYVSVGEYISVFLLFLSLFFFLYIFLVFPLSFCMRVSFFSLFWLFSLAKVSWLVLCLVQSCSILVIIFTCSMFVPCVLFLISLKALFLILIVLARHRFSVLFGPVPFSSLFV